MSAPFESSFRKKGSRDIVVGMVTGLRSGEWRRPPLFPGRGQGFLASPKYADQHLWPKQLPFKR